MQTSEIDNDLTSAAYWDSWWNKDEPLDDPIQPHWTEIGRNGFFLRAVERHVGSLSGKSVAELGGCMSTKLLAMTKWRGVKATIIDYSEQGLQRSAAMFAKNNSSVELIFADFFSPALDERKFDVVTHWGVLEHQVDPFPLIKRSVELTKPGGYVVFSMPQMRGPGAWLWRRLSPRSWQYHTYHSDANVSNCFERCGNACKTVFWGPPFIHMAPCETSGLIPALLGKLQFYALHIGKFRFVPYHRGLPYLSQVRAFVARIPEPH